MDILVSLFYIVGTLVSFLTSALAFIGFHKTTSPTLLRLTIGFLLIGSGFFVTLIGFVVLPPPIIGDLEEPRHIQTIGAIVQTVGLFFIAFSHALKAFVSNDTQFRAVIFLPLFLVSVVQLEHIFKSISFMLLAYIVVETIMSYIKKKNTSTLLTTVGFGMLLVGEFISWYSLVFPESLLLEMSLSIKIIGLCLIAYTVGVLLMRMRGIPSPPSTK